MHFIILERPRVVPAVLPRINAFTMELIILDLAFILGLINPLIMSLSRLRSLLELPKVSRTIRPELVAKTIRGVFAPAAFVHHAFLVAKNAEAIRVAVPPAPLVDVPVAVDKPAHAVLLAVQPVTFVQLLLGVYVDASAFSSVRVLPPFAEVKPVCPEVLDFSPELQPVGAVLFRLVRRLGFERSVLGERVFYGQTDKPLHGLVSPFREHVLCVAASL